MLISIVFNININILYACIYRALIRKQEIDVYFDSNAASYLIALSSKNQSGHHLAWNAVGLLHVTRGLLFAASQTARAVSAIHPRRFDIMIKLYSHSSQKNSPGGKRLSERISCL